MHHGRAGHAVDRPAGPLCAALPVHLLAVHEIALVQQPHLAQGLAAHHQRGPQHEVHREGLARSNQAMAVAAVETRVEHWLIQPTGRREEVQAKLGQAGETKGAVLKAAVGVSKLRAARAGPRRLVEKTHQLRRRVALHHRVGVEQPDMARLRCAARQAGRPVIGRQRPRFLPGGCEAQPLQGQVVAGRIAQVFRAGDQPRQGKGLGHHGRAAVAGRGVNDPDLGSQIWRAFQAGEQRPQTGAQQRAYVIADNDNG